MHLFAPTGTALGIILEAVLAPPFLWPYWEVRRVSVRHRQ